MMNRNADYLGMINLLRSLRKKALINDTEARKIAARLMEQLGADIIISF